MSIKTIEENDQSFLKIKNDISELKNKEFKTKD
jgi:hypothetical protein